MKNKLTNIDLKNTKNTFNEKLHLKFSMLICIVINLSLFELNTCKYC